MRVAAPRAYVFDCLTSFGRGTPLWPAALRPQVLSRDGDDLLVRLRTRRLGRVVAGIHHVRVRPPDRILLDLLEGALGTLHETLRLESDGASTWMSWTAELGLSLPLAAGPLTRLIAGPLLADEARSTLRRFRITIEAAALASGVAGPRPTRSSR